MDLKVFKKQTVKISLPYRLWEPANSGEVEAHVFGQWAIHRPRRCNFTWSITHVPTGLGLGNLVSFGALEVAKRFVRSLDAIGMPPLGDTFGEESFAQWDYGDRQRIRVAILALKAECEATS